MVIIHPTVINYGNPFPPGFTAGRVAGWLIDEFQVFQSTIIDIAMDNSTMKSMILLFHIVVLQCHLQGTSFWRCVTRFGLGYPHNQLFIIILTYEIAILEGGILHALHFQTKPCSLILQSSQNTNQHHSYCGTSSFPLKPFCCCATFEPILMVFRRCPGTRLRSLHGVPSIFHFWCPTAPNTETETVFGVVFWALNTFSGDVWSTRDG